MEVSKEGVLVRRRSCCGSFVFMVVSVSKVWRSHLTASLKLRQFKTDCPKRTVPSPVDRKDFPIMPMGCPTRAGPLWTLVDLILKRWFLEQNANTFRSTGSSESYDYWSPLYSVRVMGVPRICTLGPYRAKRSPLIWSLPVEGYGRHDLQLGQNIDCGFHHRYQT
jgi:hypothetical protein